MSELIFNEEKHKYTHGGLHILNVTSVLEYVGITDYSMVREADLEYGQKRGKYVHTATSLDDRGELDYEKLSGSLRPYVDAWRKYISESGAVIVENELKVHSHTYLYCGTLDRILLINGLYVLVDIKTSATMHPAIALQTIAYAKAWEEMTGKKISYRRGIQLKPNGTYKVVSYKERTDWMNFLSALKVCLYRKENNLL